MFQTKVLDKIKTTHFMFIKMLKIMFFMR